MTLARAVSNRLTRTWVATSLIFSRKTLATPSKWSAVDKLWGQRAAQLISNEKPTAWTDSPLVQQMYIHPLISGTPNVGWLETISKKFFNEPVKLALSLGCGGGGLERHGVALNIAEHFIAYDVSESSIKLARQECERFGSDRVTYDVADLNVMKHPKNRYDAVFASQSLHHIESLEHYLDQVLGTLKPNGLFIINEFVGPNQFQWTDIQLDHARTLLNTIPKELRESIRGNGLKTDIDRPTIKFMNEIDPTEAIRSADIIKEIETRFEIVEKTDFGGTLLQLVLEDIAGNFIEVDEHKEILQSLFDTEQQLLKENVLESDFTLMVMRKR